MKAVKTKAAPKTEALPVLQAPEVSADKPATKKSLEIMRKASESEEHAIARVALSAQYTGAVVARDFSRSVDRELDVKEAVEVLSEAATRVLQGNMGGVESLLVAQSIALNAIFTEMARRGAHTMGKNAAATESYMRMAFKAQNQCRATLETLAEVKNPRQATFVKQQNVANQQQVNNGVLVPGTHARTLEEDNVNQSSKLLEGQHGEWMDTRATGSAIGANPHLAAVETIDWTENAGRESRVSRKPAAARSAIG